MRSTRRSLKITSTTIAAVVFALLASRSTEAIIIINSKLANFGYVGLAAGQMARIHLFNQADLRSDEPCMAGLRLFDDANRVLAESNAALRPGQTKRLSMEVRRLASMAGCRRGDCHARRGVVVDAVSAPAGPSARLRTGAAGDDCSITIVTRHT